MASIAWVKLALLYDRMVEHLTSDLLFIPILVDSQRDIFGNTGFSDLLCVNLPYFELCSGHVLDLESR